MSAAKAVLAAAAITCGVVVGLATGGDVALIGAGVVVAAANGYSKSYSP